MKPVKFQSESDFAKSISTESKVFSIYAVGVVKGYKRETRVRSTPSSTSARPPSLANLAGSGRASASRNDPAGRRAHGDRGRRRRERDRRRAAAEHRRQVLYFNIE